MPAHNYIIKRKIRETIVDYPNTPMTDEQSLIFVFDGPGADSITGAKRGQDTGGTFGPKPDLTHQQRVPVSVQRLKQQVNQLLNLLTEVFDQADRQPQANIELDEIELTVEVNAEGQLGILGNGGKVGSKGGITLKFKRLPSQPPS